MSACGASDPEAIDGFHTGENVYLKVLIRMLRDESILNQYAKLSLLQHDTEHVVDRYTHCPELRKLSGM